MRQQKGLRDRGRADDLPPQVTYNAPWPPFIDANGAVSRFEVRGGAVPESQVLIGTLAQVLPSWGTNGSVNAYSITVKVILQPSRV